LLLVEGGSGKQGCVKSVGDATNDSSYRSYVKIMWDAGGANDYRRGHEGSLDVKCVTAAKGEMYYKEHLPKLGNHERIWVTSCPNNIRLNDITLTVVIAAAAAAAVVVVVVVKGRMSESVKLYIFTIHTRGGG